MKKKLKPILTWVLALGALAFVIWAVPIRDRAVDPLDSHQKVSIEDTPIGCVLHRKTGNVPLAAAACSTLVREPGLSSTFARVRGWEVVAIFLLYLSSTWVWSIRWRSLLALGGVTIRIREVWRISLEAQAGGVLLPGGIGGDAFRIAAVSSRGTRLSTIIASVFVDRVVGLVTMALVAIGLGFATGGLSIHDKLGLSLISIPVGATVGFALLRTLPSTFFQRIPVVRSVATPLLEYAQTRGGTAVVLRALFISIGVSVIHLGVIRCFAHALGAVPTNEAWVYVGAAFAFIVSAIPTLPGAWGTGDAAFVYFLGKAGFSPAVSLAICLLYRLSWYSSAAVGAALLLVRGKNHERLDPDPGTQRSS